ncbi:MAG: flagellar biosynthesis protein FliQ [Lachnospiraceae bacterium]
MTEADIISIARETLWTIIQTALPLLLVSMIIGLIISLFQTLTSIQEQTLTFVPKLLAIFIMLMLIGNWILNTIVGYMGELWGNFSIYVK